MTPKLNSFFLSLPICFFGLFFLLSLHDVLPTLPVGMLILYVSTAYRNLPYTYPSFHCTWSKYLPKCRYMYLHYDQFTTTLLTSLISVLGCHFPKLPTDGTTCVCSFVCMIAYLGTYLRFECTSIVEASKLFCVDIIRVSIPTQHQESRLLSCSCSCR